MSHTLYDELPGFEHVYLEDSYITDIIEDDTRLLFMLDVVLTKGHPLYQPPDPGEQYCYRLGSLEFPCIKRVTWHERHFRRYTDAVGRVDYGNIDVFYFAGGIYHIEGDWGNIDIQSDQPALSIIG